MMVRAILVRFICLATASCTPHVVVVKTEALKRAEPAAAGMNASISTRVDSIIEAAIADHASPGAAVAIARHGIIIKLQGYGRLDYRSEFGTVNDSSIYDLASLSKVIGTTTAAMLLVEEGQLTLDAPLSRYLPELAAYPDKQTITIRNLLLHNAGFPPFAS